MHPKIGSSDNKENAIPSNQMGGMKNENSFKIGSPFSKMLSWSKSHNSAYSGSGEKE